LYSRWGKKYRIIYPPPTPKKTPSAVKDVREASFASAEVFLGVGGGQM
jgi:hypothetical protein